MKVLLGEKIGMTQVFDKSGNVVPVTLVWAPKNVVVAARTNERDGYEAVQLGQGRKKHISKSVAGHTKGLGNVRYLREFRASGDFQRGATLGVEQFSEGELVKVSGISKSKGFQGVVKRHGFHGAPATHGTKHAHREPGSIGATWPQRVIKGMRMAGRMGGVRASVRNLKVVHIDSEKEVIGIRGAVPGRRGTLIEIRA
ncbi:MAG: 50S ribosomal protein L3 [Candidatus Sungbacteria bacterium]|nr:50S ribosomal protein L3 [Candidatus Sungbacteria bacterium]